MIISINSMMIRFDRTGTFIYRVSIVKLTKLSKFEFEVRLLKNQKNYKNSSSPKFDQNSIFGSIEPNREKRQECKNSGTVRSNIFVLYSVRFRSREKS
jgi:hypothetical protein